MAPKAKKSAKALQQVAALTALLNTYKAACRRYNVAPQKHIVTAMEDAAQDVKKVDKISLSGPDITAGDLKAVLEVIAGYPAVKNLCMWSCNVADEGLHALSQHIKAAATDRWWRGSKIRLLEVVSDGASFPPGKWQERYMAMMSGALVTQGPGQLMPSLVMGEVVHVTPNTLRLQERDNLEAGRGGGGVLAGTRASTGPSAVSTAPANGLEWEEDLNRQFSALMASTAGYSSLTYSQVNEGSNYRKQSDAATSTSLGLDAYGVAKWGALPTPPPAGFATTDFQQSTARSIIPLVPSTRSPLAPPADLTFSPHVLRELSLSLSATGVTLQVLALDHNMLGDLGLQVLALGLKRCLSLKSLSLENCGIGHVGATALGDMMTPCENAEDAARQPKLAHINLSRNNLGGVGLVGLCEGISKCVTLKVLNLSSIGLTEDHIPALEGFCDALASNPGIEQIDLNANLVGDKGLSVFIPWLTEAKHVRKFRVTSLGISRPVGAAFYEAIRGHFPKKKGVKKKSKK